MKILFLGVRPSEALEKVLHANRFTVILAKKGSETEPNADLVIFAPRAASSVKETVRLRKIHPDAWIAVVASRKWLRDAAAMNALVQCETKDDVWLEDTWEALFWLGLQRAMVHGKRQREMKALQHETRSLKSHYAELSQSSDRLIRQLEKDVGLATNIQRSLLPKVHPSIPGVSVTVKYIPAAGLGGDYYDIFEMGDRKHFGILMADSKTHGMAAALLSVLLKTRIEEMKDRFPDSKSFVEYLNQEIQGMQQKELSQLALLYGILDRSSLTFRFTVAGHLKPLLWRSGAPEAIAIAQNPPLGGIDHFTFRENSVSLKPGDLLILHTDGLEAPLTQNSPSAFEKMAQILKEKHPTPDPLEVQNELMALIDRFTERKPLQDDLTLIHLSIDERALYAVPLTSVPKSEKS